MTFHPTFQAQNPTISGYWLGWSSCTCYAGAMAASYHRLVPKLMTGGAVRQATGDTVGGTTLAQVNYALNKGWNVDLDIRYKASWSYFVSQIEAGRGAILQGWYAPIADSRFDAGGGFRGNHAVFVPPDWHAMDPLADGRRAGIYKYHGEAYPQTLLKNFAGRLNIGGSDYQQLGPGYVYAAFTRDNEPSYQVHVGKRGLWVYTVKSGVIIGRVWVETGGFSASSTAPHTYPFPANGKSYSLVKLTSGSRSGQYIPAIFAL
jgi:hypothetical protein